MGLVYLEVKPKRQPKEGLDAKRRPLDWHGRARHAFGGRIQAKSGARFVIRAAFFLSFVMVTMFAAPAWAYFDPNAGGLIFQIAMPILSLGLAGIAFLRKRIIGFVKKLVCVRTSSIQADQNAAEE